MAVDRSEAATLFGLLQDPLTTTDFFDRVADDVRWTVMGTHPLAGTYAGKSAFFEATFARLNPLMREGVRLELRQLFVDGDTVIAELEANSTTLEGAAFDNHYCWVCRFDGELIVEVRAYLDSAMVAYTVDRNEQRIAGRVGQAQTAARP